ncbi:Protein FRIGIDA [Linum perenne]
MEISPISNPGAPAAAHSPRQPAIAQAELESFPESAPQLPNAHVKTDTLEANDLPIDEFSHQQSRILDSVEGLSTVASAIQKFRSRFDELEKHLNFTRTAIEVREQPHGQVDGGTGKPGSRSELNSLCETMCGRSLRKYIIARLNDPQKLREEVPSVLKKARKPAKLVMDCIGGFYLQGSRAYSKDSPMISGREACILALEYLLMTTEGEVELEDKLRQESTQAAVGWRKRLVLEGGLRKASEIDAKGLLVFIACYGIPKLFKNEDIWDLVLACNNGPVFEILRNSRVLVSRITEIIEQTMTSGMKGSTKLEAVDVASSFAIDDKFPPQKLLTAYLRESKDAMKKRRREANNSPALLKQANDLHLSALKSVMKFLEDRKLDPLKVIPGWQFAKKMSKLEQENVDLNRKIMDKTMNKRRADGNDMSNKRNQHTKRPRVNGQAFPPFSSMGLRLHEQNAAAGYMMDGQSQYNTSLRANPPAGGVSAYGGDSYPSSTSAPYSSAGRPWPENVVGGRGGLMHAGGVGLPAGYNVPASSASAGTIASILQLQAVVDRAGQIVGGGGGNNNNNNNNNNVPYGIEGVGNGISLGQSYVRPPTYGGLFGSSSSMEGFTGHQNSAVVQPIATATNPADLYNFADGVVDTEYNGGV